ncbi:MAG: outer membrane lipoprotein chaperone LolA [Burkholderiales bacterium]
MKIRQSGAGVVIWALCCGLAWADGLASLKTFVNQAKAGQAQFSQTVTSPDGAKKKTSSGYFEFSRPNRFRFVYKKPFEQVIVADGRKVWMYDPDLNQVTSRALKDALGATPAALLAGTSLDQDFDLSAQPTKEGLSWVRATPKIKESQFQYLNMGFKGHDLVVLEILDSLGQRSVMTFSGWMLTVSWPADHFFFAVPAGADVLSQ